MLNNLFLYVKKEKYEECLKYGIKLSEYANIIIQTEPNSKKGIISYLSPKDSDLYLDNNYVCLKIKTNDLQVYISNLTLQDTKLEKKCTCKLENYTLGDFEEPIAIICTTILPENISLYNSIIDSPLLVQDSKEFYYNKRINELIDDETFSCQELYKALIILGERKGTFEKVLDENNIKAYINKSNKKIYTNVTKF